MEQDLSFERADGILHIDSFPKYSCRSMNRMWVSFRHSEGMLLWPCELLSMNNLLRIEKEPSECFDEHYMSFD